jgi:hypothetical protein
VKDVTIIFTSVEVEQGESNDLPRALSDIDFILAAMSVWSIFK